MADFFGGGCSVPLCYVYPAMLHYKACARTRKQKAADIALMIFGMTAALYTTVQTLRVSLSILSFRFPFCVLFSDIVLCDWVVDECLGEHLCSYDHCLAQHHFVVFALWLVMVHQRSTFGALPFFL